MILIAGTMRMPAAKLDEARPALQRVLAATHAEDGCLDYRFAEDVLDPGLIHVTELWRDQAALNAHIATPHVVEWRAAGPTFGIGEHNFRVYDVGEPRTL